MKRIVIAIMATLFATSCVSAMAAEGPMPQHHRHHPIITIIIINTR